MKGLFYKDYLCAKKNLRLLLLMVWLFSAFGGFNPENEFFVAYSCMMSSGIVYSLLSLDERSKWYAYTDTLPVSRRHLVNEKYYVLLIIQGISVALGILAFSISSVTNGTFTLAALLHFTGRMVIFCLLPAAVMLPPIYKLGAEKGRVAYLVVIAGSMAAIVGLGMSGKSLLTIDPSVLSLIIRLGVPFSAMLFFFSWQLSVRFFEKRVFA